MTTPPATLTRVRGLRVGHATTPDGASGVTVVRFDRPSSVVADVRGGASGTYDTASLAAESTYGRRWAIFFAGGSLYGLDAARGVRVRLLEDGQGSLAFGNPNPVVQISGAILFDLPPTLGPVPDYLPLGYEATRVADRSPVAEGAVGAGAGATVGKYRGRARAMRGGVGSVAARIPGLGIVGVLVAVNSVGAVRDPSTGEWIAGARGRRDRVLPPELPRRPPAAGSTTLALVVTELAVDRATLARVAAVVHAGLSAAIRPFHSATDGDVLFAATTETRRPRSSERRPGEFADRIGMRAAELAVEAVLGAVRASNGAPRR